ncbi:hypothetical protein L1987_10134 [Smallanthus sonchifolius]|uniref:Uncharacterized protein n=1 Tax=Smallanthus sonchifolius TaxID=185202 RepID=A0ACB9JRK9_9ASTR|nr:hypothetical protein L1987_10134 [Smallanthus sonchifolius]
MAVEVKVYRRKKKTEKTIQIDHIPKCFQLPRSASVSKPRTQFYLPICYFKELDTRSSKEIQTSSTGPKDRRQKTQTNSIQRLLADAKLFGKRTHVQPCSNRNNENRGDALELTPSRSQLTENREECTTPGNVVWAKTDEKFWWPAEILGERSNLAPSVLVRHFGKQGSVWVDPVIDLSPFEECFEERRCNQAKEFQNALKQALQYKEHHHDQLHERDNSPSSSRARSKRERKPKVHFDEVSRPLHTPRKVRRFRIMRSLGLAAPVGSPFNFS